MKSKTFLTTETELLFHSAVTKHVPKRGQLTGLVSKLSNSQRNMSAEWCRVQDNTQTKSQSCAKNPRSRNSWALHPPGTCWSGLASFPCGLNVTLSTWSRKGWYTYERKSEIPVFTKPIFKAFFFFYSLVEIREFGKPIATAREICMHKGLN